MNVPEDVVARFWAKVDRNGPGGCWLWTAATAVGYGHFSWGPHSARKQVKAHRLAYELLVGPIPDGLTIDHLCRVTRCVNPAHLEPVTMRVNTLRGYGPSAINARRTRCIRGHRLSGDNLIIDWAGRRQCRTCLETIHRPKQHERERAARLAAGRVPGRGGHNEAKQSCPQGHPYDDENVYSPPGTDWRICRICRRESNRRAKATKRLTQLAASTK